MYHETERDPLGPQTKNFSSGPFSALRFEFFPVTRREVSNDWGVVDGSLLLVPSYPVAFRPDIRHFWASRTRQEELLLRTLRFETLDVILSS